MPDTRKTIWVNADAHAALAEYCATFDPPWPMQYAATLAIKAFVEQQNTDKQEECI